MKPNKPILHISLAKHFMLQMPVFLSPLSHFNQASWIIVRHLSTSFGPLLFVFSMLVDQWQMVLWAASYCSEDGFHSCWLKTSDRIFWGVTDRKISQWGLIKLTSAIWRTEIMCSLSWIVINICVFIFMQLKLDLEYTKLFLLLF